MKFKNVIRVQLMLMGLGTGLLVAKPVVAQQDVDPTAFESPYSTSPSDRAGFNRAALPEPAMSTTTDAMAPFPVLGADAAGFTAIDTEVSLLLMAGIGLFVMMGLASTMRTNRDRTWRDRSSGIMQSGATSN